MPDATFEVLHSDKLARVCEIDTTRPLVTPTYFPAVSGASKGTRPIDLVRLITESRYPRLLLSAYDVGQLSAKQRVWATEEIRRYRAAGGHVFLDCGVFESYWLGDSRWSFRRYERVTRGIQNDFYAAFDGAVHLPSTRASAVGFSPNHVVKSISLAPESRCVLIAHGVNPARILKAVASLVKLTTRTHKGTTGTPVLMIAVPERECGTNVVERAKTVAAIRRGLDRDSPSAILHILGCGHPVSMAAYSNAGADSFDSTDWCEAAVDWRSFCMTDFALLSATGCPCRVCSKFRADTLQKGLLHNLLFYQTFCMGLQRMIRDGTLKDFLLENLGTSTFRAVSSATERSGRGR